MNILIHHVSVLSPGSEHHGQIRDVLIHDDRIEKIAVAGTLQHVTDHLIDGNKLFLSAGWFDLHVRFREPGSEFKEDLASGCQAAMHGGFTGVLCMPDTNPPVHTKSEVEFIRSRTRGELVDVIPCGTISQERNGKDLSEMYDMFQAGAPAFSDDKNSIVDAGLMIRALLYADHFGGKIFSFPDEQSISARGQVNEGINSTRLGMKGNPAIAEEVMITRDLVLAEYTGAPVHFSTITTKKAVALIRQARKKGIHATADVSAAHLCFDDSALLNFDTAFKIKPPLRTHEDVEGLIEGLRDGTIEAICSDHSPEDIDSKKKEFYLAEYGMSSIETAFAAVHTALGDKMALDLLVERFSAGPRKILGLPELTIREGQPANLTLFNPAEKWEVKKHELRSRSNNNPWIGMTLTGRPIAVFNKGHMNKCF